MSRIIVKNLPGRVTEARLKDKFSECGDITDVKLVKTQRGVFRRFAFVGFSSDSQAQAAIKHFHKTFINASKIEVELAKPYGDGSLNRPWSKYSKGSSAFVKRDQLTQDKSTDKKNVELKETQLTQMLQDCNQLESDPKFHDFLEAHTHKSKIKSWADGTTDEKKVKGEKKVESEMEEIDEDIKDSSKESSSEGEGNVTESTASRNASDMDYLRSKVVTSSQSETDSDNSNSSSDHEDETTPTKLSSTPFTVKMLGLPFSAKEKAIQEFFHPIPVVSVRLTFDPEGRPSGRAYADFNTESDLQRALKRNKDCIGHRYVELFRDNGPQSKTDKDESIVEGRPWEMVDGTAVEDVAESGRLFVRNLSYSTCEDDLTKLFETYGPLTEVTIPLDKNTNKPTGFAFVTFMLPEHAVKAYDSLDGQIFQGRLMHILPAKPRHSRDGDGEKQSGSSYKTKKLQQNKLDAGKGHNWNALFLGPNAIVDAIADKYSVEKSSVLDPSSDGSVAVRVALGETQLVSETREFMERRGVCLEMFGNEKLKRSKTIILVKNLPYGTTESELSELFQPFGQVPQIILPPAGVSALVEFNEAMHARNAFLKLAYTSFKHLPLYLEWAPHAVIGDKKEQPIEPTVDADTEEPSTIFVKNLNFNTSEKSLEDLVSKVGKVNTVTVAKKQNMKDPSKPLSMGYGFVEFATHKAALRAIRRLQHSELDGHKLELKLSTRETKTAEHSKKRTKVSKQTSSKILVRNVPFEASKQEIKDLFHTFGQLKIVRLPKKFGSSQSEHRGFGFVEYVTKEDAKKAFDSLCQSTHLYGRRLVLEWAESEETVEAIRKRTAEHFHGFKMPVTKRTKGTELLNSLEKTTIE